MAKKKPAVREVVNLYEAKTNLSSLVERAAEGAEIIIAKAGKPKARLVGYDARRARRVSGQGKGRWRVGPNFDAPLPDEVLAAFDGRGS